MWCRFGFDPDSFWQQTPATFQACMDGAGQRLKYEAEERISMAWHTGAFSAQAQAGKLKPLRHFNRPRRMSNKEMLANMKMLAARTNRKFGEG
jgi:hypothetical protein